MSFKINNMNLVCDPMYDKNKNNQVIGYLCASSKNVEHFTDFTLIDTNNSANFNQVKHKDAVGNPWHYLGGGVITGSNQNENTSILTLSFTEGNGKKNNIGLHSLVKGFDMTDSLPFIFHFYDDTSKLAYVIRKPKWSINDNLLTLSTFRGKDGIMDNDFTPLRQVKSVMQLRVGIYDIHNGSQRLDIDKKWIDKEENCTIS